MIDSMDIHILSLFAIHYPITTAIAVGILGLCVGSFLNVVIYRLPRMLLHDWHQQAKALLRICPTAPNIHDPTLRFSDLASEDMTKDNNTFNLFLPRSHCPRCQHSLPWWCNIPLLSFLLLRRRCYFCHHPIPWRYPIVEALAGLLAVIVLWQLGFSWNGLAGIIFTWFLLTMTMIDLDHQLIPDNLTLPLIWLGLLFCKLRFRKKNRILSSRQLFLIQLDNLPPYQPGNVAVYI